MLYMFWYISQLLRNKELKKTHQGMKLICIYLNLVLVQGRDASILLGLLKEFIPIISLFVRVYSKVFNPSLPLSFLSLSLWLCYYKITWILCVEVVHSQYSIFHDYARLVMNFYENALDSPHPPSPEEQCISAPDYNRYKIVLLND